MIDIKNRIMKASGGRKIPLSLCIILSVMLIVLSVRASGELSLPEVLIYGSIYAAFPQALDSKASGLAEKFLLKYAEHNIPAEGQKSGSMADFYGNVSLSDLSATPSDILSVTGKLQSDFLSADFSSDGIVKEITYTTQQATDTLGDVSVRNVTENADTRLNERLAEPFILPSADTKKPLVLVYHTHTTESYIPFDDGSFSSAYPTRNTDENANMIKVGEALCSVLEANGISVIHDRTVYDEKYNGAYEKSREGVKALLVRYPSVLITLDIHRDAIYYNDTTRVKPVTEINGRKAAQLMIISGAEGGNADAFPDWETNLRFALQLHKTANSKYEKLMKPLYFCNRKYNMDLTPYSLLIEVGTDVNTLEEATHSARLLGDSLAYLIKESIK